MAVIWDMHVFINPLIECEISFKPNFYMDWNIEFLFCYLAAWHEVEQNKCKPDPQLSYNNKIRMNEINEILMKLISRTFVVSVVANQDVAVQNWWRFFSQPASNVHGTCKLSGSHHRTISISPMSWLSKNLSVALLQYYAFLKLDTFYVEFMFFFLFFLL